MTKKELIAALRATDNDGEVYLMAHDWSVCGYAGSVQNHDTSIDDVDTRGLPENAVLITAWT